jgi:DNA excision repair protein ERCC-4
MCSNPQSSGAEYAESGSRRHLAAGCRPAGPAVPADRGRSVLMMPRGTQIVITADVHERASEIPQVLASLGVRIVETRLAAGDYVVGAGRVVERKSVADLHGTILEGRFWAQIGKLRAASRFPYLLVEGRDLDGGPLHPNAVRGACLAVIEQRVALLRTGDQSDTARWLHRLAARCQGQLARRDRPPYAQRPTAPLVAAASEAMLAAVPGIATSSARALLDRFGSVVRVAEASFEEILRVPGIGPERAHALRAAFGDRAGRIPQGVPSLSQLSRDRVRVARR